MGFMQDKPPAPATEPSPKAVRYIFGTLFEIPLLLGILIFFASGLIFGIGTLVGVIRGIEPGDGIIPLSITSLVLGCVCLALEFLRQYIFKTSIFRKVLEFFLSI